MFTDAKKLEHLAIVFFFEDRNKRHVPKQVHLCLALPNNTKEHVGLAFPSLVGLEHLGDRSGPNETTKTWPREKDEIGSFHIGNQMVLDTGFGEESKWANFARSILENAGVALTGRAVGS